MFIASQMARKTRAAARKPRLTRSVAFRSMPTTLRPIPKTIKNTAEGHILESRITNTTPATMATTPTPIEIPVALVRAIVCNRGAPARLLFDRFQNLLCPGRRPLQLPFLQGALAAVNEETFGGHCEDAALLFQAVGDASGGMSEDPADPR